MNPWLDEMFHYLQIQIADPAMAAAISKHIEFRQLTFSIEVARSVVTRGVTVRSVTGIPTGAYYFEHKPVGVIIAYLISCNRSCACLGTAAK